jgi:hypothetical protein
MTEGDGLVLGLIHEKCIEGRGGWIYVNILVGI